MYPRSVALMWAIIVCAVCIDIRGLSPEDQHLDSYDPEKEWFTCLDGSATIPMGWVNDGYCDCADGSDEPGTAACSNGKFYCQNIGSIPKTIPSALVDDGLCHCCDGSDENPSLGVVCPNTCALEAASLRVELWNRSLMLADGLNAKDKMMTDSRTIQRALMLRQAEECDEEHSEVSDACHTVHTVLETVGGGDAHLFSMYNKTVERDGVTVCLLVDAKGVIGDREVDLGMYSRVTGHNTLVFSDGAPCGAGGEYSLRVSLVCGRDVRLTRVVHMSSCEFEAELATPTMCDAGDMVETSRLLQMLGGSNTTEEEEEM